MLVVVHPQVPRQPQREGGKCQAAREGEEVVEDGDTGPEEEADGRDGESASQPDTPVDERVALEVDRVPQDADEEVLGGDVDVEARADEQTGQADAVGDFLDQGARAPQGWRGYPLAAPSVHDQAEGQV